MSNVGYATLTILPVAQGFSAALGGQINPALTAAGGESGRRSANAFGGSFLPLMRSMIGPALGLGLGLAVGNGIKDGLATASFMEQARISFETLLGPGGDVEGMLTSLSDFAKRTPFELPGLVANARSLLGVGIAADQVLPTMNALGDSAAALGLNQDQLNSVMRAWTQIQSKGKVQAEELLQISEAGLPIWPLLAKAMGKTVPELQAMMQKGELLANDVLPILAAQMQKDYGGSMAKQALTLQGVWSTVTDTLNMAMAKGLEPLVPLLTKILPPAADALAASILFVSDGIVKLADLAGPAINSLISGFGGLAGPTDATSSKFGEFLGTVQSIANVVTGTVLPAIGNLVSGIVTGTQPLVAFLVDLFVNQLFPVFADAAPIIGVALGKIGELIQAVAETVGPVLSTVAATLGAVWEVVGPLITGVLSAVFQTIGQVFGGIIDIVTGAVTVIQGIFTGDWDLVWKGFSQIVDGAVGIFRGLIEGVGNIVIALFAWLIPFVVEAWNLFTQPIVTGVQDVIGFFVGLNDGIIRAISGIGSWLFDAGKNLVQGLIDGIGSMADWIYSSIVEPIQGGIEAVKNFLGIHSPSRLMFELGRYTGQGMANGLFATADLVARASKSLIPAVPSVPSFGSTDVPTGGLAAQLAGLIPAAGDTVEIDYIDNSTSQEDKAAKLSRAQTIAEQRLAARRRGK